MKKLISLALLLLLIITAIPYTTYGSNQRIQITIPSFKITLNGTPIDSSYREYPFIVYKGITYFPMTYSDCRYLGLETTWDILAGLGIANTGISGSYQEQGGNKKNSLSDFASICDFPVIVNGKAINNSKEEYPLLVFRNVTYFPLTWRFAVDEFGWAYSYSETTGLIINSSGSTKPVSLVPSSPVFTSSETPTEINTGISNWKRDTVLDITFEIPSDWRKESKSCFYFYPTSNNADGFILIQGYDFKSEAANKTAKIIINSFIEGVKSSDEYVRDKTLEHDLTISGYPAAKHEYIMRVSKDEVNAIFYYILKNTTLFTFACLVPKNSTHKLPEVLERVVISISTINASSVGSSKESIPTPTPTPPSSTKPTPTPKPTPEPKQEHYFSHYGPRGGAVCICGKYMSQH